MSSSTVFSPLVAFGGDAPELADDVFVATGVHVIGDVSIAQGASVWYGAVLRGDVMPIRIGARTNIQDQALLHATTGVAPTIVGADVTVGHRAILHGCTVEDGCLIGMGAILLDEVVVGEGSLVGAGALLTPRSVFPPGSLIMGSPARVKRELTPEEVTRLRAGAHHYVENAILHAEALNAPTE